MSESNIKQLQSFLNYCVQRHNVIAKNIANIGTENYQREDVSFIDTLNQQINNNLKTSSGKHIAATNSMKDLQGSISVATDKDTEASSGINNVDIEQEMALLAENTLLYKFASRKVGSYYKNLQSVIKGGQR